jgi:hypothetical protein
VSFANKANLASPASKEAAEPLTYDKNLVSVFGEKYSLKGPIFDGVKHPKIESPEAAPVAAPARIGLRLESSREIGPPIPWFLYWSG